MFCRPPRLLCCRILCISIDLLDRRTSSLDMSCTHLVPSQIRSIQRCTFGTTPAHFDPSTDQCHRNGTNLSRRHWTNDVCQKGTGHTRRQRYRLDKQHMRHCHSLLFGQWDSSRTQWLLARQRICFRDNFRTLLGPSDLWPCQECKASKIQICRWADGILANNQCTQRSSVLPRITQEHK